MAVEKEGCAGLVARFFPGKRVEAMSDQEMLYKIPNPLQRLEAVVRICESRARVKRSTIFVEWSNNTYVMRNVPRELLRKIFDLALKAGFTSDGGAISKYAAKNQADHTQSEGFTDLFFSFPKR